MKLTNTPKQRTVRAAAIPFESKTMFLGLGPTKTGTTWLYRYLNEHPDFFCSPIKELNFFSALCHPVSPRGLDRRVVSRIRALANDPDLLTCPHRKRALQHYAERLRMTDDPEHYRDFFRRRVAAGHQAFGELSPNYCALSTEGFRFVRDFHPRVRVLLCLRDPLDRVDALLRQLRKHGKAISYDRFIERLGANRSLYNMDYEKLLDTLFAVLTEDEAYIQFFEDMFNQPAVDRITGFIGISRYPGDFDAQPAHSPPGELPSDAHRERLLEILAPVYAACRARFGDRIPPQWAM